MKRTICDFPLFFPKDVTSQSECILQRQILLDCNKRMENACKFPVRALSSKIVLACCGKLSVKTESSLTNKTPAQIMIR